MSTSNERTPLMRRIYLDGEGYAAERVASQEGGE